MKKHLFPILFCAICTLVGFSSSTKAVTPTELAASADSKLVFTPIVIDYGTIDPKGEPFRKAHYKNTGTKPITILKAQPSCGCVRPNEPKDPIQPGAEGDMNIWYDTQREGAFTKIIRITTDESDCEPQIITIKGIVNAKPSNEKIPSLVPTPRN
jgi:hypothetical protein